MANYYNDFDPKACAWLRELIAAGLIPPGDVDERSIADVRPSDLAGYNQCHFFAGIGGWPLALGWAGLGDTPGIWTGSCPCQPFSSAGKRKGHADERHLWPEFARLIRECRPATVFGEQVEGAVRLGWLDGVFADLEREGYACGAAVLGAHSVGAPHIRQRLFWLADAQRERTGAGSGCEQGREGQRRDRPAIDGDAGWSSFDIIPCRDGKARRIERQPVGVVDGLSPALDALRHAGLSADQIAAAVETWPLVEAQVGRAMLLKGYGNAIVPQVAVEFIKAWKECQ